MLLCLLVSIGFSRCHCRSRHLVSILYTFTWFLCVAFMFCSLSQDMRTGDAIFFLLNVVLTHRGLWVKVFCSLQDAVPLCNFFFFNHCPWEITLAVTPHVKEVRERKPPSFSSSVCFLSGFPRSCLCIFSSSLIFCGGLALLTIFMFIHFVSQFLLSIWIFISSACFIHLISHLQMGVSNCRHPFLSLLPSGFHLMITFGQFQSVFKPTSLFLCYTHSVLRIPISHDYIL